MVPVRPRRASPAPRQSSGRQLRGRQPTAGGKRRQRQQRRRRWRQRTRGSRRGSRAVVAADATPVCQPGMGEGGGDEGERGGRGDGGRGGADGQARRPWPTHAPCPRAMRRRVRARTRSRRWGQHHAAASPTLAAATAPATPGCGPGPASSDASPLPPQTPTVRSATGNPGRGGGGGPAKEEHQRWCSRDTSCITPPSPAPPDGTRLWVSHALLANNRNVLNVPWPEGGGGHSRWERRGLLLARVEGRGFDTSNDILLSAQFWSIRPKLGTQEYEAWGEG